MSNVEQLPVKARETGPAVTLIGTDLPESYLDEAEPSPMMLTASEWWLRLKRVIQVAGLVLVLGFYPALVIGSHVINDDPIALSADRPWTSAETGTMVTLIGREIEGPGWAADRPGWHPQARLTGLPALAPAEDTAPEPAPEPDRPGSPVATPALDVQAHAEHALEAIVDEERRDKRSEDLLTHDAPTE